MLGLLKDEGFLKAEDGVVAFFQLGDGAGVRLFHFVDQRSVAVVDTLQQVVRMRGGVEVHIVGAVKVGDAGEWFFLAFLSVRESEILKRTASAGCRLFVGETARAGCFLCSPRSLVCCG
jgi:hypothetical protein